MPRSLWLLPVALVIAASIPLLLGGRGALRELGDFPTGQLVLMLGLIVVCWNLNALRLRLLLAGRSERLSQSRAVGVVMATEFAICATPGGSGGPLTLLGLLTRHGVRPTRGSAIFIADQLTDLTFFLAALIGVALYAVVEAIELNLGWLIGLPILLLGCGLLLLWLMLRHTSYLLRLSGGWLTRLRLGPTRRRRFAIIRRLLSFRRALIETLRLPRHILVLVFALCCGHWLLRYSVLYLAIDGLGESVDWAWTFVIQMLAMAAGQLSFLPGGAGGVELTSSALLMPLIGKHSAAAAVLIWRFVTYYFYLLVGAPVFLALVGRTVIRLLQRRHT
ncbi:conserved hypothetical protein [Modicisalibacter muralis]|uniref:Lysylphosphatidylglycerol synthase TM region n=1 Tax=Modicisalibacter muralis TaxID=119000 RepID=A0A1G9EWW0_9GAMM|nr:lysylphosphatidylglycerol synthase transmembrane domain-containing protein [Halomonas muralis]SDK80590.1 conserved hypothetical protein [Halomonas muralis]